jgi:hypothetical protein
MPTFAHAAPRNGKAVVRALITAMASAAILVLSQAASAQQSRFGTADEARATLLKAVAAVKADKANALAMLNRGEGGVLDLHAFCTNASDGSFVALHHPDAGQSFGRDIRTLRDSGGRMFGLAQFAAAQKPEGQLTEVSYRVPNSGVHTTPLPRASLTTRIGDLVCGVSYYPMASYWFEGPNG